MASVNFSELQFKAINLREEYGFNSNMPIDVFGIILATDKITLQFNVMNQNLRGMSIKDADNMFIVINSSYTLGSQRFTAIHELYHLLFHEFENLYICNKSEDKKPEEIEADAFASYFIMPDRALKFFIENSLGKKTGTFYIDDFINIEQYFGISHEALVNRMIPLKYITREEAELMKGVKRRSLQLGFDTSLYESTDEIKTYGYYVRKVVELVEKDEDTISLCDRFLLDANREDMLYGNKESE